MSNVSTQNALLKRYRMDSQLLLKVNSTDVAVNSSSKKYRVIVPDGRVKMKHTIYFVPSGAYPTTVAQTLPSLWLTEGERDDTGIAGIIPCLSIWGTQLSPAVIVSEQGVFGWSIEQLQGTMADAFVGVFSAQSGPAMVDGEWFVSATWQPLEGWDPSKAEWEAVKGLCQIVTF